MLSDPQSVSGRAESLADYTSAELIVPALQGHEPTAVIQELTRVLRASGRISDALAFYHAAANMEFLHSSVRPSGVALPYARSAEVSNVCFAVGRSVRPVGWKAGSQTVPVQLIFLLALPSTEASDYISVMLSLGELGNDRALLEQLRAAPSAEDILSILRRVKRVLP